MFLQETPVVVLIGAAPKGIDLEERIAGLAIGVFGVKSPRITPGLSVEQKVDGVPLGWRKILHRQVVPLRTERSIRHWRHKIETIGKQLRCQPG